MAGRRHLWIISALAVGVTACSADETSSSHGSAATTDGRAASSAPSTTVPENTAAPTTATSAPSTTTAPATSGPRTTSAPTSAPPSTVASFEPPEVEVVVTDAGAEPIAERRLSLSPGTIRMTTTQTQELAQTIDGFEAPSTGPITITMAMDIEVEVVADGYRLTSTIVDARPGDDVDPAVAEELGDQLAFFVGLGESVVIDDRGRPLSETDLSLPDGVPDSVAALASSFDQVITPLPAEPIGPGATWTVDQEIDQLGVLLLQRWEFELVEIDGDRLHVVGAGTQTVDPGPVELPGVPSVVTVTITSWEGRMSTDIWHDLTTAIADTTTTVDARQEFTFEDRTSSGELVQDISTSMTVSTG